MGSVFLCHKAGSVIGVWQTDDAGSEPGQAPRASAMRLIQ
jgi:hypothetical protein